MGNWTITIAGVGPHHNGRPFDADQLARRTHEMFQVAGHSIEETRFTYGGAETTGGTGNGPMGAAQELRDVITEKRAIEAFNAYNECVGPGQTPWLTYDGKPVPRWEGLNDAVREKWRAAVRAGMGAS